MKRPSWFYLSVALNFCFIFFFAGKRYYYSHAFHSPGTIGMTTDSMNNMGIRRLNQVHVNKGDIVFIGTSITEGLPIQEFTSERIKDFGIGWNKTSQIKNRLDSIIGKPSKIFIEAGVNDLREGISIDTVISNYRVILEELKGSKLYVQSILPVSGDFVQLQSEINILNTRLQILSKAEGATYIDISKSFGKGLTIDGLHPNSSGYKWWISEIDSLVN